MAFDFGAALQGGGRGLQNLAQLLMLIQQAREAKEDRAAGRALEEKRFGLQTKESEAAERERVLTRTRQRQQDFRRPYEEHGVLFDPGVLEDAERLRDVPTEAGKLGLRGIPDYGLEQPEGPEGPAGRFRQLGERAATGIQQASQLPRGGSARFEGGTAIRKPPSQVEQYIFPSGEARPRTPAQELGSVAPYIAAFSRELGDYIQQSINTAFPMLQMGITADPAELSAAKQQATSEFIDNWQRTRGPLPVDVIQQALQGKIDFAPVPPPQSGGPPTVTPQDDPAARLNELRKRLGILR